MDINRVLNTSTYKRKINKSFTCNKSALKHQQDKIKKGSRFMSYQILERITIKLCLNSVCFGKLMNKPSLAETLQGTILPIN